MAHFNNGLDAVEGIAQRQREAEPPVVCPECGSTHFAELTFNQYSGLAYGAGAGGDLRITSMMPQTIRVCVCSYPYAPNLSGVRGRAATQELDAFKNSLKLAHEFRKKLAAVAGSGEISMTKLVQTFANLNEFDELKVQIEQMKREIENLKVQANALEQRTVLTQTIGPGTLPTNEVDREGLAEITEQVEGASASRKPASKRTSK
jgi:hypothetical protein